MFEYFNNKPGVEAKVLYETLKLCSYNQYKTWVHRGKLQKLRNACPGHPALVRFDTLPETFKESIRKRFGNPFDAYHYHLEEDLIPDHQARTYYSNYRYNGRPLTTAQINKYTLQAEIFNALQRLVKTKKAIQQTLNGKMKDSELWQQLTEWVHELDPERYPHKLNKHYKRLKKNYVKYIDVGYQALVHGNLGNQNSAKVTPEIADWITAYYALPNKPTPIMLQAAYGKIRHDHEWPELSESAIVQHLQRPEVARIWTLARDGKDAWTKRFGWHGKRSKEEWFPNCYWAIDGTKLDWLHYMDNSMGMAAQLKINIVIDVFSEKVIGYSYSTTEDHTDHFKALKMAANTAGSRPYLLSYDNQSGHKSKRMQELYTQLVAEQGGTHYPHRAYRKSNPIEQVFNRFQQQVLNMMWFSDGQTVKARSMNNIPNMDFIKANKHRLKDKQTLLKSFEYCVSEWNASTLTSKGISRNAAYGQTAPMAESLSLLDMVHLFWVNETRPIRYQRGGLRVIIAGQEHWYEVYDDAGSIDVAFRREHVGNTFVVRYDPEALDQYVQLLRHDNGGDLVLVAMAQPKRTHQVVPALMKDGDKNKWNKDYKVVDAEYNRDLEAYRQLAARTGLTAENLIEEQELKIKMGGDLPKEERSEAESSSFLTRL